MSAVAEPSQDVLEFHRQLAAELFSHVLNLLDQPTRTCAENDRMIHAAHASRFHYEFGGSPTNFALGEWQCARVHTIMRQSETALYHAWRYLEYVESYDLGAFHLAYAHTALSAAFALTKPEQAKYHEEKARETAALVEEEEARKLVEAEIAALAEEVPPVAAHGSSCCG